MTGFGIDPGVRDARGIIKKKTIELVPGDTVWIPWATSEHPDVFLEISSVVDSGYVNFRDETIYHVSYAPHDNDWGPGNTASPFTLWDVLIPYDAGDES